MCRHFNSSLLQLFLFVGTHQSLVNGSSEHFRIQLLGRYYFWYAKHDTFRNVCCRYSSRLAYAHTIAVMSMVGYILGLGDRHGENILFDSTNGDCVHVDFNCLFNRVGFAISKYIYFQIILTF